MEAKELMIGDWVFDKAVSDKPVQIEQINEQNVHYKRGNGYMPVGIELLEPIPITPEILEKNGFIKEWDGDIIYMSFNNICIEIGSNYKVYQDGRYYIKGIVHRFYYVHQLQQALRLLGIEKQIEL